MLYEDLGKRVRQQRKLAQLTQEKLAEKAGISFAFVGHIERGTRKASLETLVKLANALRVKLANALRVSPEILLQDSLDDDLLGSGVEMPERHKRLLREISERIREYETDEN